jgi:hypothetical protein
MPRASSFSWLILNLAGSRSNLAGFIFNQVGSSSIRRDPSLIRWVHLQSPSRCGGLVLSGPPHRPSLSPPPTMIRLSVYPKHLLTFVSQDARYVFFEIVFMISSDE